MYNMITMLSANRGLLCIVLLSFLGVPEQEDTHSHKDEPGTHVLVSWELLPGHYLAHQNHCQGLTRFTNYLQYILDYNLDNYLAK